MQVQSQEMRLGEPTVLRIRYHEKLPITPDQRELVGSSNREVFRLYFQENHAAHWEENENLCG